MLQLQRHFKDVAEHLLQEPENVFVVGLKDNSVKLRNVQNTQNIT